MTLSGDLGNHHRDDSDEKACSSSSRFARAFFSLVHFAAFLDFSTTLGSIRFLEEGWAGGIQGRVINFLPAQEGRVSINLTQQRGGSL